MATDHKPVIISALGAVPKPDTEEVRLIHDCSQPAAKALNDYADQTLDNAISLLTPGCYMAKIDLRHAYRSVHIDPDNYEATRVLSGGLVTQDISHTLWILGYPMPQGRRALGICNCLTQAVKRMMARRGYRATLTLSGAPGDCID